jgi:hypothetical protein
VLCFGGSKTEHGLFWFLQVFPVVFQLVCCLVVLVLLLNEKSYLFIKNKGKKKKSGDV